MFMPPYGGLNFPYKTNLNWIVCQIMELQQKTGSLEQAWTEFQKTFGSELDQTVKDQLTAWLNDGTLASIISGLDSLLIAVSVIDYGAKGDGVTNDTEAIQNCINENDVVFLPAGTYLVTTINIPSGKQIIGAGNKNTIIKPFQPTNALMQTLYWEAQHEKGYNSGSSGWRLSNITLDGNNKASYGIRIVGYRYKIDNVYIRQCETGLISEWGKELGQGEDGLTMEAILTDNIIERCTNYAMLWRGPHDSIIKNTYIRLNNYGISVTSPSYSLAAGTIFDTCHIYANQNIGFFSDASVLLNNVISESNGYNSSVAADGFALGSYCPMINCWSFNNTGNGVSWYDGSTGSYFTGTCQNNTLLDFNLVNNIQYVKIDAYSQTGKISENLNATVTAIINGKNPLSKYGYYGANYNVPLPSGFGSSNAVTNTYRHRCLVTMNKALTFSIVKADGNLVFFASSPLAILEAGDSIYFSSELPTQWSWVYMQ